VEYFSKRTSKLMEKQRRTRLAQSQLEQGGVEISGGSKQQLAERLFFSSTQMELDVEGLLLAAQQPSSGQAASAAEPGAGSRQEGDVAAG